MRIVQACRKLGLEFVCVHTAEDIHSGHVRIAKELGGEKSLYQVSPITTPTKSCPSPTTPAPRPFTPATASSRKTSASPAGSLPENAS